MSLRQESYSKGAKEGYANKLHRRGTLKEILAHINDSEHGRVLNLLSLPVSANMVGNEGMK